MRHRVVILALAITAIVAMLACSATGGLLARNEPTATPTKTPKPTFTITPTPTLTPIPTDTPTPTATFTPTPEATNTPIVLTATPTETPTETPVPTNTPVPPTATRKPAPPKPAATATKAPPPNTPAPTYAFQGTITGGTVNCGTTGVKGKVKTKAGGGYAGVTIALWTDGWEGAVANPADGAGNWNVFIREGPVPGNWYLAVVKAETCNQRGDGSRTAMGCERQSNVVTVVTTANCTGQGAVQWPEVEFRQN